jgi:nitroreductase
MGGKGFQHYTKQTYTGEELLRKAADFRAQMEKRRTVRDFSDRPVPAEVIRDIIMTASTAPSGAHKQPWTFCVVSEPSLKAKIREAAEQEEYDNYHGRMSKEWLEDLAIFGTDWHKPFLETAPWLIIIFRKSYDIVNGERKRNYYVQESVGIAAGMLLTAIHEAGLVALTHTPSPMNFLTKILNRPENERPFLLIPVGYPAPEAQVPILERKTINYSFVVREIAPLFSEGCCGFLHFCFAL